MGRVRKDRSGFGKEKTKYTEKGPGTPGGTSWTIKWLKFDNSYFKVCSASTLVSSQLFFAFPTFPPVCTVWVLSLCASESPCSGSFSRIMVVSNIRYIDVAMCLVSTCSYNENPKPHGVQAYCCSCTACFMPPFAVACPPYRAVSLLWDAALLDSRVPLYLSLKDSLPTRRKVRHTSLTSLHAISAGGAIRSVFWSVCHRLTHQRVGLTCLDCCKP